MTQTEPAPSLSGDIAIFRRFNRMYTRLIGTLNEGLLNSDFRLAEARVLYELATLPTPRAKEIVERLGMDAGYLSRLLGKFERTGLLKRETSEQDGRFSELILTSRGKSAFRKLDELAEAQGRDILERLPSSARLQLIDCLRIVENILSKTAQAGSGYVLRSHRVGDMGWIVHREGLLYAEEYGWDETFEALVAQIVNDFITNFDSRRERCWIAEIDGQNVGHVFLVKHPDQPQTAKLRLLLVEPSARGHGLGHILVDESIRFARTAGYRKVVLWTQSILTAAHRIYEKAGFHMVKQEPHHSFGYDLIAQIWELELRER
jgi:DNA-binding MarR family transcriptional regulator/GNAT superfamily N-acetyltransferase